MSTTSMFGKTYTTIGSSDSNFLIKTKGDFKIQWGGKFIDVIKDGKIASGNSNFFNNVSSKEDISEDGIYIISTEVGNEVWLCVEGTKINIAGEIGTTYVSFLAEQKDITSDQKYTALYNAGLYYPTLEDAQKAGIKAGIVYIEGDNKIYIVKNGQLLEYTDSLKNLEDSKDVVAGTFDELFIGPLRIYNKNNSSIINSDNLSLTINGIEYLGIGKEISISKNISIKDNTYLQSLGANSNSGFRIYKNNFNSVLEVDSIIWRNINEELNVPSNKLYSTISNVITNIQNKVTTEENTEENIEANTEEQETITENLAICTLKYKNEFSVDQKIYILIGQTNSCSISIRPEEGQVIIQATLEEEVQQNTDIEITYSINKTEYSTIITIEPENNSGQYIHTYEGEVSEYSIINSTSTENIIFDNIKQPKTFLEFEIQEIEGQTITLNLGSYQYSQFKNKALNQWIYASNVPLIEIQKGCIKVLNREQDNIIHSAIGNIEGIEDIENYVGMYSDNFIGINSQLYDCTFKLKTEYPRYDSSISIPSDFNDIKYNNVIPNITWVKQLISNPTDNIPSGIITMFNGKSPIPTGWALCDGNNGTPNLIGQFIKGTSGEIGQNNYIVNETPSEDSTNNSYSLIFIMKL